MTKTKKYRQKKGGSLNFMNEQTNSDWLSTISQNASDMWNNISQNTSDLWIKTKQSFQTQNPNSIGGKKTRKMRGGYVPYTNLNSIAENKAESWQPTAKPQVWVGGRTKKYKKNLKSKK